MLESAERRFPVDGDGLCKSNLSLAGMVSYSQSLRAQE
jgi:hypothetical protein